MTRLHIPPVEARLAALDSAALAACLIEVSDQLRALALAIDPPTVVRDGAIKCPYPHDGRDCPYCGNED